MTPEELADKFARLKNLDPSITLAVAVGNTVDAYYDRIFIEHKKTDGSEIEYKSNNPVYINSKDGGPQKLTPKGKTGKQKFASGRPHVSTYFESYKNFKKAIGKPILELFGSLQSSISSGTKKISESEYVLAVNDKEGKKIEGLQFGNGHWSGFGTIFKLNNKEKELFQTTFANEMKKQFDGTANN